MPLPELLSLLRQLPDQTTFPHVGDRPPVQPEAGSSGTYSSDTKIYQVDQVAAGCWVQNLKQQIKV